MSTTEKETQTEEKKVQAEEKKIATRYDRRTAKRAEEKAREKKAKTIWACVGIVAAVALVAWIASYPIKYFVAVNKTVCTIDGEKIGQVEFDYYYNVVKTNYMNSYGSYLSYYGLTSDTDPSTVSYDGTLSFKDYFEETTIGQIKQNIALKREMEEAGYTYDATADYEKYMEQVEEAAKTDDITVKEYLQSAFGQYMTESRLKPILLESYQLSNYYDVVYDSKLPTDDEIESYYEENADTYDSVDYYLEEVDAVMPTEPTELADEGATVDEDGSYTPSDAEEEAAMEVAKAEADTDVLTVMTDGEEHTGELKSSVTYYIRDWLFDEARVEGDTTVIENSSSNLYYVVGFKARYRAETPTVSFRAIVTSLDNGAEILSAYDATAGTEDDFAALVDEYSEATGTDGGLYENQEASNFEDDLSEWLFSADRSYGDVTTFYEDETTTYVIYYVGAGDPVWKTDVRDAIMSDTMSAYIDELVESVGEVSDPDGNLAYIALEAQEAAEEEAESTDSTDSTDTTSEDATDSTETTAE